ncbi:carbonic anhydrase family protein [Parachitinimonas caeni]|uniref:Carbonic anhydrase family protein n=1 Tax=Parachitinimonas caeni TaxID=3031301 RepID=A0ABT7DUR8_9NEIS|nr:carbonic anhydrase family protein [Parachitinimonas caeni]MDK2123564.1 carbonic anhydrase family protein [Parachitinimonas caeni]
MMNRRLPLSVLLSLAALSLPALADNAPAGKVEAKPYTPGATLTQSVQASITPDSALDILKAGNARFVAGKPLRRDLKKMVTQTALGQFPYASVVGCIDSRAAPEVVFDQSVGDIFTARVAGNTVNEDILGSLEYAAKVAGSRLVVVLGHTSCGAIKGACDDVKMGNLTTLLDKLKPAVEATKTTGERNSKNHGFVHAVTESNVKMVVQTIRDKSQILKDMEAAGQIKIVGALYDTSNGKVTWY